MGIVFTRLFSSLFGNREARILVLGLDNAGKTTILSIGFNVETVQYNNIKFQVWDLGAFAYWLLAFNWQEDELKGAVVLVYANKQDLPGALDDAAITESLELHKIKSRQWAIFKTSAIKGEGLFEGLDWLSNALKSKSS
uniref:ADP-ribosylation factor n=1 Tax=Oryza punctata TaxID=4537 RepID=A0A0E0LSV2_ORYPU